MIVFDLSCGSGHVFEAWFDSSGDYEDQKARHLIACPVCGDGDIEKAVMAPAVAKKGNAKGEPRAVMSKDAMKLMGEVRRHVEENFEYVGPEFAKEARLVHEGETPERSIYGEATTEETKALHDDGIEVYPLPMPAKPGRSDA